MNTLLASGWQMDRQYAWVTALAVFLSIVYGLVPNELLINPTADVGPEQVQVPWLIKAEWLPMLALVGWMGLRRWRLFSLYSRQFNPFLFLMLGWMLLSAFWAPDAGFVLRQTTIMICMYAAAIAFCMGAWSSERFTRISTQSITLLMVLSLIVVIIKPSLGVHSQNQIELLGAWRGITYQKNGLGQLASVGIICWFYLWANRSIVPWKAWLGILFSFVLVVKSKSSTSLLISLIACVFQYIYLRPIISLTEKKAIIWTGFALLLISPLLIYTAMGGGLDVHALSDNFGKLFGKDATFSGRTYIWAEVIRNIAFHPWLGIGYNSFWLMKGGPADVTRSILQWDCPNGHNGYLDVINETGYVGFSIFLAFLLWHIRTLLKVAGFNHSLFVFHSAIFIYVFFANMTETGWFHPIAFTHIIIMFSSAVLSRAILDQQLKASSHLNIRP